MLRRDAEPGTLLSPPLIALLLIANLLPAIALMVLLSRKLAIKRASEQGMGSGRLHTRLVALFSVIAAVPTVLVAIFASLLFQSGLEFWFSDRARSMLENTVELARSSYDNEVDARRRAKPSTMSGDLAGYLATGRRSTTRASSRPSAATRSISRNLSEAIIFTIGADGQIRTLALVNPYDRPLEQVITAAKIGELQRQAERRRSIRPTGSAR